MTGSEKTNAASPEATTPAVPAGGKLYIKTQGCQMNVYDSARMADLLAAEHGLSLTEDESEADVILINTCSIREKAQEKVFSQLGKWKHLKKGGKPVLIGLVSATMYPTAMFTYVARIDPLLALAEALRLATSGQSQSLLVRSPAAASPEPR